jgi:hypothetical protein
MNPCYFAIWREPASIILNHFGHGIPAQPSSPHTDHFNTIRQLRSMSLFRQTLNHGRGPDGLPWLHVRYAICSSNRRLPRHVAWIDPFGSQDPERPRLSKSKRRYRFTALWRAFTTPLNTQDAVSQVWKLRMPKVCTPDVHRGHFPGTCSHVPYTPSLLGLLRCCEGYRIDRTE